MNLPKQPAPAPRPVQTANTGNAEFGLRRSESCAEGIRREARGQIDAARKALERDDDPVKAIHEARKALKKARALLRLVSRDFDRQQLEKEKALFRDAAAHLSPLRDAYVRLKTVDTLLEKGVVVPEEFIPLRRTLARQARRLDARIEGPKRRAIELLSVARKRVSSWPMDDLDEGRLWGEIRRTYRKGRRALAAYRKALTPETFHTWRKRVKDLWYQLRLMRRRLPGGVRKKIKRLNEIGRLAGDAHDLSMLRDSLKSAAAPGAQTALLAGEIDALLPEFCRAAVKQGERFYKEKPSAFARRLEG